MELENGTKTRVEDHSRRILAVEVRVDDLVAFMNTWKGEERERDKQHRQNTARLNIIIGILIAIAAYMAIVLTLKGFPKTVTDIFALHHDQVMAQVQQPPQEAGGPEVPNH